MVQISLDKAGPAGPQSDPVNEPSGDALRTSPVEILVRLALAIGLSGLSGACAGPSWQTRDEQERLADLTEYLLLRPSTTGDPSGVEPIDLETLVGQIANAQVVFVGEIHTHPAIHLFQMQLLRELARRHPRLALSLEQFERNAQPVLDDYLKGHIGEEALIADGQAWPNYRSDYRPLIEYARQHGFPIIAANAPEDLVRCVGRYGPGYLDRLPDEQRQLVATDLDLKDGVYKRRFWSISGGHALANPPDRQSKKDTGLSAMLENRYAAQVARDDTMAESITRTLESVPGTMIMHLAGQFHIAQGLGTVERVRERLPRARLVTIAPLILPYGHSPSSVMPKTPAGDFLVVVRPLPERYRDQRRQMADMRRKLSESRNKPCPYAPDSPSSDSAARPADAMP